MSEEVQTVLTNYLAVIGKKDADIFSYYEQNETLKLELSHVTEEATALALQQRDTEKLLKETQLDNVSLCSRLESVTAELLSLRQFESQVRRSLVMTNSSLFSLSSVAGSVAKCVEDRDTLVSLTPLVALYVHSSLAAVQDLEQSSRVIISELYEAECAKLSLMMRQLLVQYHQLEQDEIAMSAALQREDRRSQGQRVAADIVNEVGRLQRHVEELLRRNDACTTELDSSVMKMHATQSSLELSEASAQLSSQLAVTRETTLYEYFLNLRESAIFWALSAASIDHLAGEKKMLEIVNQQLRGQLRQLMTERSDAARLHDSSLRAAQQTAVQQSQGLQSDVCELRDKLSLALQKEKESHQLAQSLKGDLKALQAALGALRLTNAGNEEKLLSLEKKHRKKVVESEQYKELLESLQQRCAQVREVLVNVEGRLERSQADNEGLRKHVSQLQIDLCSKSEELASLRAQSDVSSEKMARLSREYESLVSSSKDHVSTMTTEMNTLREALSEANRLHERAMRSKDEEMASLVAANEKSAKRREDDAHRDALLQEQYRVEIQLLNTVIEKEREHIATLEAKLKSGSSASIIQALELENSSLKMRVDDMKAACDLSVRRNAELREQLSMERAKASGSILDTSAVSSSTAAASPRDPGQKV